MCNAAAGGFAWTALVSAKLLQVVQGLGFVGLGFGV